LGAAAVLVRRYAEPQSRRTAQLLQLLEQTSEQVRTAELPRIEASLTALNTAAAGR
jgi:uroporphyrin-3 C-methyltransferase